MTIVRRRPRTGALLLSVIALSVIAVSVLLNVLPTGSSTNGVAAGLPPTATTGQQSGSCPWLDTSLSIPTRVDELLSAMTLDQKLAEMQVSRATQSGPEMGYEGFVPAQPDLCIPAINEQDGGAGVAEGMSDVTQLPAPVTLASSWSTDLAYAYGKVIGEEQWDKGVTAALAPNVDIQRNPKWGRNFETYSEDPYLSAQLGIADTEGIQSSGVMAIAKHYAVYNQETYRNSPRDDVVVGQRALHEIYLAPWQALVQQAQPAAVMCSYASPGGTFACQNDELLRTVLDEDFAFSGFVRSDGGANHATAASLNAGLDQEKDSHWFEPSLVQAALASGTVTMATINAAVGRIFTEMFRFGLFNDQPTGNPSSVATSAAHQLLAQQVAERGTVLLKDSGSILPLSSSHSTSIAVIGADAEVSPVTAGGGSSKVSPSAKVTPYQGIEQAAAQQGMAVRYSLGDAPSGQLASQPQQTFTPPVTGKYELTIRSYGPATLQVDGTTVISATAPTTQERVSEKTGTISLTAGTPVTIDAQYQSTTGAGVTKSFTLSWQLEPSSEQEAGLISNAVAKAGSSSVAIVFVSDREQEGQDLTTIKLPDQQDRLVEAVARANPDTVVVLNTGGPVTMPWISDVAGALEAWYPGQANGTAIANVLFGNVDPGGHLPETFPADYSQVPSSAKAQFPGVGGKVAYSEGIDVGYRWYDAKGITPLFPFGYGLSYTTFGFSDLTMSQTGTGPSGIVHVGVTMTNTGARTGSDVAQLYVGQPASTGEPPRQLEAFHAATLAPGQSTRLHFTLFPRSLSYWSAKAGTWVESPGTYTLYAGDSSALTSLPLRGSFQVGETIGKRTLALAAPSSVAQGQSFTVRATIQPGGNLALHKVSLQLNLPPGWQATAQDQTVYNTLGPDQSVTATWTVTAPVGTPDDTSLVNVSARLGPDGARLGPSVPSCLSGLPDATVQRCAPDLSASSLVAVSAPS